MSCLNGELIDITRVIHNSIIDRNPKYNNIMIKVKTINDIIHYDRFSKHNGMTPYKIVEIYEEKK